MPQRLAELSMTHADPIRFLHNLVYVNIHNSGVVCTLVVVVCKRITDAERAWLVCSLLRSPLARWWHRRGVITSAADLADTS
jgi:hypothetical protein